VDQPIVVKEDFRGSKVELGNQNASEKEQLLEKLNRICFREIIGI
jgi:hypothetical protein